MSAAPRQILPVRRVRAAEKIERAESRAPHRAPDSEAVVGWLFAVASAAAVGLYIALNWEAVARPVRALIEALRG